ncbi:MAG: hypothetical protein B7Y15_13800 [Bacteroidetes bacterium 24-39-8]|jgi:hypothetical protein|nr:MAG: hypothetical protein B7Y15_13800 [Bacteroidetes bacterium 24-39-8]OZA67950.1 MAG: hypothetical protein B7X72_02645 [Sphingobacteriia bacterium 39-39-8]HQR92081.1 hypothetical protein [Sediminibacterium sp.]HQS56398.1 hypothetical protein [Sediminibacterium sp.]
MSKNPIARTLQKILVNHFYQMNAGFFAFLFFVLFGVVKGGQLIDYHYSLIIAFLESPIILVGVIFAWILYTLKCSNYIIKRILEPRQLFLSSLNHLSNKQLFAWMLFVQVQVFAPVWVYATIASAVAIHLHHWAQAGIMILANLVLIVTAARWYSSTIRHHGTTAFLGKWELLQSIQWSIGFVKPVFSFAIFHLFRERKQMLLLTKLFTLLFLYGFIQLYEPYKPDPRPILLCFLLIVGSHSSLILQIRAFEREFLPFLRNLPVKISVRFLQLLLTYALLFLPEYIYVWSAYPLHFTLLEYPKIVLMVLSLAAFLHSILLVYDMLSEDYLNSVFGMMAVLFFVLLYNPGILFFLLVLLVAYVFFHHHIYG